MPGEVKVFPAGALDEALSWVRPSDAGLLAEQYDAAIERAGKVFNIVKAMSPNPAVMERSMEMYRAIADGVGIEDEPEWDERG